MTQSLGNYVSIREEPEEMFGKLMSIPDTLIGRYAALGTTMSPDRVAEMVDASKAGGAEANRAKRAVAGSIVSLYHGEEAASRAEEAFDRQFRRHEAPEDIPEADIPGDAIDGPEVYLPRVLAELGLAKSGSDGRRLISQGGVKVNGEPITGENVALEDLVGGLLQVGKRRFIRLRG